VLNLGARCSQTPTAPSLRRTIDSGSCLRASPSPLSTRRVHRGISQDLLKREGPSAEPELAHFFALVGAALAAHVCVVAHNATSEVARLQHTATKYRLPMPLLSADVLCTMHCATGTVGCARVAPAGFRGANTRSTPHPLVRRASKVSARAAPPSRAFRLQGDATEPHRGVEAQVVVLIGGCCGAALQPTHF